MIIDDCREEALIIIVIRLSTPLIALLYHYRHRGGLTIDH